MLRLVNVNSSYGLVHVLKNVSLHADKGEIVTLIGANGAGKTTLINILSGITPPTSGCVRYDGKSVESLPAHQVAALGIARTFQNIRLFKEMTVLENVMVGTFIHAPTMKTARKQAMEILEKVRLEDKADQLVLNVTLEDRKRLELARALATKPSLLLLDEVMSGLTPAEVKVSIELIRRLRTEELTIIVVEHIMDVILSLCDRIAVLDYGQKIAEDKPDRIVNNPEVIKAYLGERYRA